MLSAGASSTPCVLQPRIRLTERSIGHQHNLAGNPAIIERARYCSVILRNKKCVLHRLHTCSHACQPPYFGAVDGISAAPSEDNLRYFNVIILGPTSSPYEGKQFRPFSVDKITSVSMRFCIYCRAGERHLLSLSAHSLIAFNLRRCLSMPFLFRWHV